MRTEISKTNIATNEAIDKAIAHKVSKVQERLKRYHPDVADLEIRLEYHDKLRSHECALNLKAFRDTFHAKKSAPELRLEIDRSFDALIKVLDHYRVKISKSLHAGS